MNHFTYEDMFVGQTVEFKHEITFEMMESFLRNFRRYKSFA